MEEEDENMEQEEENKRTTRTVDKTRITKSSKNKNREIKNSTTIPKRKAAAPSGRRSSRVTRHQSGDRSAGQTRLAGVSGPVTRRVNRFRKKATRFVALLEGPRGRRSEDEALQKGP